MTEWEFISVALSLILGLAVALVLTGALATFRARRRTELSSVAIAWTAYIFVSQLQYWWGPVRALDSLERISGPVFTLMILLAVLLFLAGGVILPSDASHFPSNLSEYFAEDGRWGVLTYCVYWLLSVPLLNVSIHGVPLSHPANITAMLMVILPAVAFWSSRLRGAATVLAGVVLVVNMFAASEGLQQILSGLM